MRSILNEGMWLLAQAAGSETASEAANLLGHGALSWTIDGLALAAFGAFTLARRARAGA